MRQILRILKYVLLAVATVATAGVAYLFASKPAMQPAREIAVARTPERIARGKYLFTLADCDGCHSERDFSRFDGPVIAGRRGAGNVFPKEMGLPGVIAPPNITPDKETGIGTWTDGEKIRAIREGVDRDGRTLFPMMPYENFRNMSDEDVYSLVAYLGSLPPVRKVVPPTQVQFPVSLLIKKTPKPVGRVAPPAAGKLEHGKYLTTLAGCADCHTPTLAGGEKFQLAPQLAVVTANISPDPATGIGKWSEEYFVRRFTQYRDYVAHGAPPASPSTFTVMPWLNLCQLPDEDLRAIYSFLRTRPAVFKPVETHPGFDPVPANNLVSQRQ